MNVMAISQQSSINKYLGSIEEVGHWLISQGDRVIGITKLVLRIRSQVVELGVV